MAALSSYAKLQALKWICNQGAASPPATYYVGLFTATPTNDGTATDAGTEVASAGGYARVAVTASTFFGTPARVGAGSATFQVSNNGSTGGGTNAGAGQVLFPVATGSWGTVTALGYFDAITSGNLWHAEALTATQAITTGQQGQIAAGTNTLTLV